MLPDVGSGTCFAMRRARGEVRYDGNMTPGPGRGRRVFFLGKTQPNRENKVVMVSYITLGIMRGHGRFLTETGESTKGEGKGPAKASRVLGFEFLVSGFEIRVSGAEF
jgi:hypothetical protein